MLIKRLKLFCILNKIQSCLRQSLVPILVLPFVAMSAWAEGEVCETSSGPAHNNVASLYCITLGYETEVVQIKSGKGGQDENCVFPDGTRCSVWDFYAGTCGDKHSYCAQKGYPQVNKSDGKDTYARNYTACVVNGVEVNVSDLLGFPARFNTSIFPPIPGPDGPALYSAAQAAPQAPNPLPSAFTWRNKDGQDWMTSVKDQSQCGSCWAFSAVGATEAVFNIDRNNSNLDLDISEEFLNGGPAGSCCGGWHYRALDIIQNSGIPDEACLPYDVAYYNTGGCDCFGRQPPVCNASCTGLPAECSHLVVADECADSANRLTTIAGYHAVPNNVDTIKTRLIDEGPLSICYSHQGRWNGSVYECPWGWCRDGNGNTPGNIACGQTNDPVCQAQPGTSCQQITMNHCVVIAGYDDNNGNGYWILKNSWGAGWNGDGYLNLRYNNCYVQDEVYYVDSGTTPNRVPTAEADGPYNQECQGNTTAVQLDGTGSSDPDHDKLTYAWTSTCPGGSFNDAGNSQPVLTVNTASLSSPLSCDANLTVTDSANNTASDQAAVTIRDTTPPVVTCPADQVAECTGPAGASVTFDTPVATDTCSSSPATACAPASGTTFPLGTTTDTCTAIDASGNKSSCNFTVRVKDTTPPVITSVSAKPNVLWPPNHKMVPVVLTAQASDLCSPTIDCKVTSVTSNEPENGLGDGDTAPDWKITGPLAVDLRAERAGTGSGRAYTVTVECTDASGNSANQAVTVAVPHNQ